MTQMRHRQVCDGCAIIARRGNRVWHGDVCPTCGYAPRDARASAGDELAQVVSRAVAAGATPAQLRALFDAVLAKFSAPPTMLKTWPELW